MLSRNVSLLKGIVRLYDIRSQSQLLERDHRYDEYVPRFYFVDLVAREFQCALLVVADAYAVISFSPIVDVKFHSSDRIFSADKHAVKVLTILQEYTSLHFCFDHCLSAPVVNISTYST